MKKTIFFWPYSLICISLCITIVFVQPINGQNLGCTDPAAINYNPQATFNDGSCQYAVTTLIPSVISNLSDTVDETSGIAFIDGMLWTHNDSGNPPYLYAMDTVQGHVLRSVFISGAINKDWEELAQSSTHLYIGDFGNNNGNRKDLRIYSIALGDLKNTESDTLIPEVIAFHYPDQTDFSPAMNNNDFDAEACIYYRDSLYIFTKNWASQNTRLYRIPAATGSWPAELIDSFNVNGLITSAAIDPDGKHIVLTGYRNPGFGLWTSFAWLLSDFPEGQPLRGNKRRIELGTSLQTSQMEAVWLHPDLSAWITGEAISVSGFTLPARLSKINFTPYFPQINTRMDAPYESEHTISITPNPAFDQITVSGKNIPEGTIWSIIDSLGILRHQGQWLTSPTLISLAHLGQGAYWFVLETPDKIRSPFVIR